MEEVNDKILTSSYLPNINPSVEKLTEEAPAVNTLIKSIEIKEQSASNFSKMKRQSTKRLKELLSPEQPQPSKVEANVAAIRPIDAKAEDKKVVEKK